MKKLTVILGLILVTAMILAPAMAMDQSTTAAQIGGQDNTQLTQSTNTNNYYKNEQNTGASQSGNGNTQITTSNTINTDGGAVGATSVSNDQQVVFVTPPPAAYDKSLALEDMDYAFATLYSGQVIAISPPLNMRAGEVENLSWHSGSPMLVEVVHSSDVDMALHDKDSAPVYDDVYQYFNHNHLCVLPVDYAAPINEGFSPQNEAVFTAPADGSYTFIVDSRPGNHRDASINAGQISDNMIDFDYSMMYAGYNPVVQDSEKMIGVIDQYPTDKNGKIINP